MVHHSVERREIKVKYKLSKDHGIGVTLTIIVHASDVINPGGETTGTTCLPMY